MIIPVIRCFLWSTRFCGARSLELIPVSIKHLTNIDNEITQNDRKGNINYSEVSDNSSFNTVNYHDYERLLKSNLEPNNG